MGASKELFMQLREELSNELIDLENGDTVNGLDIYHQINCFQKDLTQFKSEAEKFAKDEIERGQELDGYDVKIKNGAKRYDFKSIKAWQEKNKELKKVEEQSKQALLSIEKGMMVATDLGEDIELPKVMYSKDSISITKRK